MDTKYGILLSAVKKDALIRPITVYMRLLRYAAKLAWVSAILILEIYPCESGFPVAKNRGKIPLTRHLEINLAP